MTTQKKLLNDELKYINSQLTSLSNASQTLKELDRIEEEKMIDDISIELYRKSAKIQEKINNDITTTNCCIQKFTCGVNSFSDCKFFKEYFGIENMCIYCTGDHMCTCEDAIEEILKEQLK